MKVFYFVILLIIQETAFAQEQYVFNNMSFLEGLTAINIQKTIQDKYGFIWVATQDGLFRSNGNSFDVFRKGAGKYSIFENFVFDIQERNGYVYIITFNGGIDKINLTTLDVVHLIPFEKSKTNYWAERFFIDKNENIFISFNDRLEIRDSRLGKKIQFRDISATEFCELADGSVLIACTDLTIKQFKGFTFTGKQFNISQQVNEIDNQIQIRDLRVVGEKLFMATANNIYQILIYQSSFHGIRKIMEKPITGSIISSIEFSDTNILWIGTNNGIYLYDTVLKKRTQISREKKLSRWLIDNTIQHLMKDREDNMWISSSKMLQYVSLKNKGIRSLGTNIVGTEMDHIFTLAEIDSNTFYATGTNGLFEIDFKTGEAQKIPNSQSFGLIHFIQKTDADFWIISSETGLLGFESKTKRISKSELLKRYPEWKKYSKNIFNTAVKINDIYYWASEEQEGLIKWDKPNKQFKQFNSRQISSNNIPENHIHNLKFDTQRYLWLMCDNSLIKFDINLEKVVKVFENGKQGLNSGIYFDMYDDGKYIWVGTYGGGLSYFSKRDSIWRSFTEANGLTNNCVYGILPESDTVLWVSTNYGLSRINSFQKTCTNFYYEDGIHDNSFDEKGALKINNELLFAGLNGVTKISVKDLYMPFSEIKLYINKVSYKYNDLVKVYDNILWNEVILPSGTNNINIHLACLNPSVAHKVKFYYKIMGNEQLLPVSAENIVSLNALAHGKYHISIVAKAKDNYSFTKVIDFHFRILPKWYQTWWFKLLVFLITAGIIYAFYRYRIRQIEKQHAIRKNIATDLHDDLGSTLNSVKVFTNLAISGVKQEESLQQVKDNLTEATMSLRDMIWVLDDSLDTVDELVTRLKQFAFPITAASNMEFVITAGSDVNSRTLTKEEKRNLFLICKEAINNSIKYSGATQITVAIIPDGKRIQITVADNGEGFNLDEVKKGYGLKNMQYRAGQIKYKVALDSYAGKGTQIKLTPF